MTHDAPPAWHDAAREYLARELHARAPCVLTLAAVFDEQPLDGEGRTALFAFDLPTAPGDPLTTPAPDPQHYVAVGETEPSYFPAYGFEPDDAYSLHIGTRFALVVGLERVSPQMEPSTARAAVRNFVTACNPGIALGAAELAALFRCDAQLFAVYRVTLRDRTVYCFGADCPPGFSPRIDLPPQVPLRLHLGRLVRAEARADHEAAAGRSD